MGPDAVDILQGMNEVDLGWTAGIMDGEGTVSLFRRGPWRRPVISVTSTDSELVGRLKSLHGGRIRSNKLRNRKWRPSWEWRVINDRALEILCDIEPLMLCPKKKERARLLIYGYKAVTPRNGCYTPEMSLAKEGFERTFFELEGKLDKRASTVSKTVGAERLAGRDRCPPPKLGWLAGIMDGEGSITLQPNKPYFRIPRMSVVSTDRCMLEELVDIVGGNISNRKAYKENESRSWSWAVTGQRAIRTLEGLEEILTVPEKARRAQMLVREYGAVTKSRPYTEEERFAKLAFEQRFLSAA